MKKYLSYALAILVGCVAAVGASMKEHTVSQSAMGAHAENARPAGVSPVTDPPAGNQQRPTAVPGQPVVAGAALPAIALRTRIDSLEDQLKALTERLRAFEQTHGEAAAEATLPPQSASVVSAGAPAEPQPTSGDEPDPDARVREMQALLANQTPDPGWELMASTDVATAFERAAPAGTALESLACTGRICQLNLVHDAGATLDDLLLSDPLAPWPHRGMAHAIDVAHSVLYLVSEEP